MNKKLIAAGIFLLLFLLLIIALKTLDVSVIGPEETSVGLSQINGALHNATGISMLWYKITNYLGYFSILAAICFACSGLLQLVRRKSLGKVDRELLVLGGLYVLLAVVYVLFEFLVINYRPVIIPGDAHMEASFPSSHTMLAFTILGSTIMVLDRYISSRSLRTLLQAVCGVLLLIAVFGRLLSGVHWFTDIIGGILISACLLFLFAGILDKVAEN